MENYKIKVTDEALSDMEQIYNYIAYNLLSPEKAMKQYNKIADVITSLSNFPEKFRCINGLGQRRAPVGNYSVFYVIKADTIYVTNVLYSASDIEKRLK
ncbi:MAG: type II toxin-antitoxin system RelE/ParE family toxin [Firmicutes bacterium]|nr:type II toxin-antitoxin system RelE/ParE family toxin [Bacillota bacterium]